MNFYTVLKFFLFVNRRFPSNCRINCGTFLKRHSATCELILRRHSFSLTNQILEKSIHQVRFITYTRVPLEIRILFSFFRPPPHTYLYLYSIAVKVKEKFNFRRRLSSWYLIPITKATNERVARIYSYYILRCITCI